MSDLPLPDPTAEPALLEPLDIQHDTDPAPDEPTARRTPHIGHALLFFVVVAVSAVLVQVVALLGMRAQPGAEHHPILSTLSIVFGYLLALVISFFLFPLFWHKPFLDGIHWTARPVHRLRKQLIFTGFLLTLAAQGAERLIRTSPENDLMKLIVTPASAWILAIAGSSLIPAVEEIAFRGFLLPALAIAYDWLSLQRTPAAVASWQQTTKLSRPALLFGALLSSLAFATLHGFQLHWGRGPLAILFGVSLVLSAVRLLTRSVACSTLVHAAYNGTLFIVLGAYTHGYLHLDRLQVPK